MGSREDGAAPASSAFSHFLLSMLRWSRLIAAVSSCPAPFGPLAPAVCQPSVGFGASRHGESLYRFLKANAQIIDRTMLDLPCHPHRGVLHPRPFRRAKHPAARHWAPESCWCAALGCAKLPTQPISLWSSLSRELLEQPPASCFDNKVSLLFTMSNQACCMQPRCIPPTAALFLQSRTCTLLK